MRSRTTQVTAGLLAVAGAAALIGCASRPTIAYTTNRYAANYGFQRVERNGGEYFCRSEARTGSLLEQGTSCFSRKQMEQFAIGWRQPGAFSSIGVRQTASDDLEAALPPGANSPPGAR